MTVAEEVNIDSTLVWAPSWSKAGFVLGVSLLVLGTIFSSTYADIVAIWWRAGTYAHGFLILPIVGYLLWEKRSDIACVTPMPSKAASLLMVFPALLWLVGHAAQVAVVEQFSVVAMLPVLVWAILGTEVVRRIIFPLAYLFFAVPAGDFLVAPLQDVTATFTVWALQITGIPVYWEGRFFHIPSGSFEVAEACSGVRYLIASLALGTLYAYLTYTSIKRRLIFVLMAAIVPIVANGIRAYGIVMLANLSDYTLAVGIDHLIYGWVFFGVVIMAMFWVGSFFREELTPSKNKDTVLTSKSGKSSDISFDASPDEIFDIRSLAAWAVLTTTLAIGAPGFAAWMDARSTSMPVLHPVLPSGAQGWNGPYNASATWNPHFVGAEEQRIEYRKDGRRVQVYLAYYSAQNRDAELISWHNAVFDSEKSRRLGGGYAQAKLADGKAWPVIATRVEVQGRSRMVWHWYEIDGTATVSKVWAKLYAAQSRLFASSAGSAAWALSTEYELKPEEAEAIMEDFLTAMLPRLRETVN